MSIWGKRVPVKRLAVAVAIFVVAGLVSVTTKPRAREITLVAKGMAFYVEGNATANPVIDVKAGETVRIILRNEDRGMTHDFAVPASKVSTDLLNWNQQDAVTFEVPGTPGIYEYVCKPHLVMMKGTLRVN